MADDWLTDGADEGGGGGGGGDDDWLTAGADEDEAGGDWLQEKGYRSARVRYGSPCGAAVPLGRTYWCEQSQRLISERCTVTEIDSFLSPDCHKIYDLEEAQMWENKSLNSFECPRCPCTLGAMADSDGATYYLWCSFCRWDSRALIIEQLGNEPFVDKAPDQLILRLMKLEKEVGGGDVMNKLVANFQRDAARGGGAGAGGAADGAAAEQRRQAGLQEQWGLEDLRAKLEGKGALTAAEQAEQELRRVFDETSADGSSVDRAGVSAIRAAMRECDLTPAELDAAMGDMGAEPGGSVGFERLSEWWRRSTAPERGPTTEEILLADAQRFRERVGAEPMDSAPLAQRFTQPSVQPELVRQLVPRRKALIPRMLRRSIYSDRIVVKPSPASEAAGLKAEDIGRSFELLELGLEHVPQVYVAELPDAEAVTQQPTPLQLTVTNPLDTECTLRLCDASLAPAPLEAEPGDTPPGKHKGGEPLNARVTWADGQDFAELKIAPKPVDLGGYGDADAGDAADTSGCVVVRNGNRVRALRPAAAGRLSRAH